MIRLKNLILESKLGARLIEQQTTTPVTVYEFQDSFPDNIVLPIKPNQATITSFSTITAISQLTTSLQDFINTLNAAVRSGKLKTGTIKIESEANSATTANNNVPKGGWTQDQVNFSYSNGAKVTNQTLADRRAEGIEAVIKKFVKLPAEITISKTANGAGSKKSAKAVIPILTYNKNTNTTITIGSKPETINPNATKYVAPSYTDTKIGLAKCGEPMISNGLAGDPIAFRTKLEPTSGTITIEFLPQYVPDRFVIIKLLDNNATVIHDSGYVSVNPDQAQVEFGKLLDELNKSKPNGYSGEIKNASTAKSVSVKLDDPAATYYFEVYAPLGPTVWDASLTCSDGESTATKPSVQSVMSSTSITQEQWTQQLGNTAYWNSDTRIRLGKTNNQIVIDTADRTTATFDKPAKKIDQLLYIGTMKQGKPNTGKETIQPTSEFITAFKKYLSSVAATKKLEFADTDVRVHIDWKAGTAKFASAYLNNNKELAPVSVNFTT
jgi:hypothetical protein